MVLLEVKADLSTASERWVDGIVGDGDGTTCSRLPDVLLVIIVFRDDLDALSDQVSGVETNTKLTDHRNVGTGAESLHETLIDELRRLQLLEEVLLRYCIRRSSFDLIEDKEQLPIGGFY